MTIKIQNWIILTEFGINAISYIFVQTDDVSEDEIALCIQEQIYGDKIK